MAPKSTTPPKSVDEARARILAAQGARMRHVAVMDALLTEGRFQALVKSDPDKVLVEVFAYIARGEPYPDEEATDGHLYRGLRRRIDALVASGAVPRPHSERLARRTRRV